MIPRTMTPAEHPAVARLWHDGWHRAHAAHVPAPVTALRTLDSFAARVPDMRDRMRVGGAAGAPLGLCAVLDNEVDQLFVAASAYGTGLAQTLLADAEARIAQVGHRMPFLFCVPQNARAVAFYRRQGWADAGLEDIALHAAPGLPPLQVIRFEKAF